MKRRNFLAYFAAGAAYPPEILKYFGVNIFEEKEIDMTGSKKLFEVFTCAESPEQVLEIFKEYQIEDISLYKDFTLSWLKQLDGGDEIHFSKEGLFHKEYECDIRVICSSFYFDEKHKSVYIVIINRTKKDKKDVGHNKNTSNCRENPNDIRKNLGRKKNSN